MEQLLIFAALLSLGYFFGRRAEKKHYRSISEREAQWLSVPATSGKRVLKDNRKVDHCQLATGSVGDFRGLFQADSRRPAQYLRRQRPVL